MAKKITVAIVDDVESLRESLEQIVNFSNDFECVCTCKNANEAMVVLPVYNPDLVMMDIGLPDMSGIECVSQLKLIMPSTQFMMCTIFQDDDNIFKALGVGASGYLLKKSNPTQIIQSLKELYEGGSPMSAEIARRVVASFYSPKKEVNKLTELTQRETEILQNLAKGLMYKEISTQLNISTETVRKHVHNIYEKLHVQTRQEAVNILYGKE